MDLYRKLQHMITCAFALNSHKKLSQTSSTGTISQRRYCSTWFFRHFSLLWKSRTVVPHSRVVIHDTFLTLWLEHVPATTTRSEVTIMFGRLENVVGQTGLVHFINANGYPRFGRSSKETIPFASYVVRMLRAYALCVCFSFLWSSCVCFVRSTFWCA